MQKKFHPQNRVISVDVTVLYERYFGGCPNESAYCSPYTLLRLLADLVPGMPDKLLYLDADILFQRDIRLLYDKDVSHVEYAAARDHYGKYLISPDYINAGVLLLNMKNIRRTGLFMKARKLLQTKNSFLRIKARLFAVRVRKCCSRRNLMIRNFYINIPL